MKKTFTQIILLATLVMSSVFLHAQDVHFSQFFDGLKKIVFCNRSDNPKKEIDTSGKSGAYQHHREN